MTPLLRKSGVDTAPSQYRRRASMYVMVLGTSLAVSIIGLSALMVVRLERRWAEGSNDFLQARFLAQSAVEMGLFLIDDRADWRNTYPSGVWISDQPCGKGTYTLEGLDPNDGDLSNNDTDPVVLIGTGEQGQARYRLQVTLSPESTPLSCLEISLQVGTDLLFDASIGAITVNGDQILAANNVIAGVGDVTVHPAMEAVTGFSGTLGPGTTTAGVSARVLCDAAAVFDYYTREATPIDWFSLPDAGTTGEVRELTQLVLSPSSNPYGATDPDGVYLIDCRGYELCVSDCRIVGTLVVVNARSTTLIAGSVNWAPAVANYPALLLQGSMRMWQKPEPLDEAANGVNFNPAGTPYEGVADADTADQYPSVIKGIVYVSNDLNASSSYSNVAIDGVMIVGNTFTVRPSSNGGNSLDFTYDQRYYNDPPPAFGETGQMKIVPGSWRRAVD